MAGELITLPNGVRVALDPMPELATAAVGVWVRVGARWEAAAQNGVAHLFEHMAFKGAGGRDARAYAEAVEDIGAQVNAATGYERTSYYARTLGEHAAAAFDLVADIVRAPTWRAEDLETEKGVVLQEIGEAHDQPDDRVFEILQAGVFPDQALGRPILGDAQTLAGVSLAALEAFRDASLTSERVVIAAAGAFDRDRLLERVQGRFGDLRGGADASFAAAQVRPARRFETRRLAQYHMVLSWGGPAACDPRAYAFRVLSEILGGGMSSRLFQEVREKRGLVYAIDSYLETYEDCGRLGVYAGCGPDRAGEVAGLVDAALCDLAEKGPAPGELDRAKTALAAAILMGAEAPMARAEARAGQIFTRGALLAWSELRARVLAVSAEDVRNAAASALAGPHGGAGVGAKAGAKALEALWAKRPGPAFERGPDQ